MAAASEQASQWSQCGWGSKLKKKFYSVKAARRHRRMRERQNERKYVIYSCPHCGYYHVGRAMPEAEQVIA